MSATMIAADSEALVSLALADELDALLVPEVILLVPDMVRYELVRQIDRPGAQAALDWIRAFEREQIFVVSTEEFEDAISLQHSFTNLKKLRTAEHAARQVLEQEVARGAEVIILLVEDMAAAQATFVREPSDKVLFLSAAVYLNQLNKEKVNLGALLHHIHALGRHSHD